MRSWDGASATRFENRNDEGTRLRGVMKMRSFRTRLGAWYFMIIAVGLSVFGVGAWLAMRSSLYHSVDDSLGDRIQGVKHFMDEQISALSVNEIRDEFR